MREVQGYNGGVLTLTPYGEVKRYGPTTEHGGNVKGGGSDTYLVPFQRILKLLGCPVEGSLERENNPGRLMEIFMYRHWNLRVEIV